MRILVRAVGVLAVALIAQACGAASPPTPTTSQEAEAPSGPWRLGSSMPTARSEMPAVVLEGRIYVPGGFGGLEVVEYYDPQADEWGAAADLPQPRHHLMAAAFGGELFVFGGARNLLWRPTDSAWAYDPRADAWRDLTPMPEPRLAAAAARVGDTIYIVGGTGGGDELLAYSPETDSWSRSPGPAQAREHVSAVALGGELWVLGGRWSGEGERRTVDVFNPANGTWRGGPSMLTARAGFAAAAADGQVMAAGGERLTGDRDVINSVELLQIDEGGWRSVASLPHPVHGMDAVFLDGRWFIMGGSERAGGIRNAGRVQILSLP